MFYCRSRPSHDLELFLILCNALALPEVSRSRLVDLGFLPAAEDEDSDNVKAKEPPGSLSYEGTCRVTKLSLPSSIFSVGSERSSSLAGDEEVEDAL
jgi:hypothetical protein